MTTTPTPAPAEVFDPDEDRRLADARERAGRRSDHGSSADRWEQRDRDAAVSRAIAVLPPEMQRRLQDPRSVISPLVVAEQAAAMEQAYQALCSAVLKEDDFALYVVKKQRRTANGIQEYEAIEQRKRKSAWRKLARYFNIDVDVTKEVIGHVHDEKTCSRIVLGKHGIPLAEGEDCSCPTTYARFHVTVRGWNGRTGFGVGIASRNERAFKAQDHSLPATAYTRGLSRAISDMIGAGEGGSDDPAETVDAARGEQASRPAPVQRDPEQIKPLTPEQTNKYVDAWKASTDDQRRQAKAFLEEQGYRDNFLATGLTDLPRVMEILGAGTDAAPQ